MSKTKKLGVEDWHRLRVQWERDPLCTYSDIALLAGCSKQAAGARAKREGWQKVNNAGRIAREAHYRADKTETAKPPAPSPMSNEPPPPQAHPDEPLADGIEDDAITQRAKVLARHRAEWKGARARIYKSIQNGSFEDAKLGKITAEALKIVQDGERKAWALDEKEVPGLEEPTGPIKG